MFLLVELALAACASDATGLASWRVVHAWEVIFSMYGKVITKTVASKLPPLRGRTRHDCAVVVYVDESCPVTSAGRHHSAPKHPRIALQQPQDTPYLIAFSSFLVLTSMAVLACQAACLHDF